MNWHCSATIITNYKASVEFVWTKGKQSPNGRPYGTLNTFRISYIIIESLLLFLEFLNGCECPKMDGDTYYNAFTSGTHSLYNIYIIIDKYVDTNKVAKKAEF